MATVLDGASEPRDLSAAMAELGTRARKAARVLAVEPRARKDEALKAMAARLRERSETILAANARDIAAAEARGLGGAMLDRLRLDPARLEVMATGLEQIAALDDPVGRVLAGWERPNGLRIERVSVPLGVIGVIYESRPNVTADAGGLCLKAGNACILRPGSESAESSRAILDCLRAGLADAGLPEDAIQAVPTTDRAAVGIMLGMSEEIDVIVPRGGRSLIERVQAESRVPVFAHLEGVCHLYIDEAAEPQMARTLALNAKMRRTGICGAAETILFDRALAPEVVVAVLETLHQAGCVIRGDAAVRELFPGAEPASDADWTTEYLDAIITAGMVDGVEAAIAHINRCGSHHTEAIVTQDDKRAARFLAAVDSAIVMHNASTQFADGGEFGMGAEIGISTGRMHARGPVGVDQLTTFNYRVHGTGQVRSG